MIRVSQNEFECVDGSMNFWKNLERTTISYFGRWMFCLYVSKFMNMCAVPMEYSRGSKSLDLEFQVVVNCLTWMLRNELRSSTRTIYALNC